MAPPGSFPKERPTPQTCTGNSGPGQPVPLFPMWLSTATDQSPPGEMDQLRSLCLWFLGSLWGSSARETVPAEPE